MDGEYFISRVRVTSGQIKMIIGHFFLLSFLWCTELDVNKLSLIWQLNRMIFKCWLNIYPFFFQFALAILFLKQLFQSFLLQNDSWILWCLILLFHIELSNGSFWNSHTFLHPLTFFALDLFSKLNETFSELIISEWWLVLSELEFPLLVLGHCSRLSPRVPTRSSLFFLSKFFVLSCS